MLIRAEKQKDRAAIHTINASAFGRPDEANLVDALRKQAHPVVSLVAEADGAVIGHILFSPVSLSGNSNLKIMGLAPVTVTPDH